MQDFDFRKNCPSLDGWPLTPRGDQEPITEKIWYLKTPRVLEQVPPRDRAFYESSQEGVNEDAAALQGYQKDENYFDAANYVQGPYPPNLDPQNPNMTSELVTEKLGGS